MTLKHVIEALVFASPKPMGLGEFQAALAAAGEGGASEETRALADSGREAIGAALGELQAEFAEGGRGFRLVEQVNGWTLVSNPDAATWVKQLYPEAKPTRLSGPALETLAIIAYRQPVTRADMEAVRGVAVDGVMQVLLDRGLVKISGRADVPGRPLLYGTTEYFLQHFGLKTTDELPNSAELKRVVLPSAPVGEDAPEKPGKRRRAKEEPELAGLTTEVAEPAPAPPPEASAVEAVHPAGDAEEASEALDSAPDSALQSEQP